MLFLAICGVVLVLLVYSILIGVIIWICKRKKRSNPKRIFPGACQVKILINGITAVALIDTGATINAISEDFLNIMNLNKSKIKNNCVNMVGIGGSQVSKKAISATVDIGGSKFETKFQVLNFNGNQNRAAILGRHFLKQNNFIPDLPQNRLRGKEVCVEMLPLDAYDYEADVIDEDYFPDDNVENVGFNFCTVKSPKPNFDLSFYPSPPPTRGVRE